MPPRLHFPFLEVSPTRRETLYEQIEEQIRSAILAGELSEGDALPSFRKLAAQLQVALITVKRAYEDLCAEGVLETVGGKGTFVARGAVSRCREDRKKDIREWIDLVRAEAARIGLSEREWKKMLEEEP